MEYKAIYEKAFKAFMEAAAETGDSYKNLSWFAKNKDKNVEQNEKQAA